MSAQADKNNTEDGKIVNPGSHDEREISVGDVRDEGDDANELRFNEEQRLIQEQAARHQTD